MRFKVVYEYFESHFIYLEMYAHRINLCFISKWQNFWGITNRGQECRKLKIFPKTDSKLFMDKSLIPKLPTKCKLCPGKALADLWLRKMSEPSPAQLQLIKIESSTFWESKKKRIQDSWQASPWFACQNTFPMLSLFYSILEVLVALMVFVTYILVWFSALNHLNNWDRSTLHFTCNCGTEMPKRSSLL